MTILAAIRNKLTKKPRTSPDWSSREARLAAARKAATSGVSKK